MHASSLPTLPDTIPTPDGWCHRCGYVHDDRCFYPSQPLTLREAASRIVNAVIDLADHDATSGSFLDRVSPDLLDAVAGQLVDDAQRIRNRAARLARVAS